MVWLALLLCAAPNPLSAARAHLKSGAPDALIIDLADDAPISLDQRAPAASLVPHAVRQAPLAQRNGSQSVEEGIPAIPPLPLQVQLSLLLPSPLQIEFGVPAA